MKTNNKRFNLKSYREKQGLTQTKMAQKLNISRSNYVALENGYHDPSYGLLEKFAKTFEFDDVWDLFKKGV